jgi:hypothetical protein
MRWENDMKRFPIIGAVIAVAACSGKESRPGRSSEPEQLATVSGFETPESVRFDAARGVFYVSNVTGNPGQKDNNGYISRVSPTVRWIH